MAPATEAGADPVAAWVERAGAVAGRITGRIELKILRINLIVVFIAFFFVWSLSAAQAAWETAARVGYDSNIDRAVNAKDRESDFFGSASVSYNKGPSGETRLNWTFDSTVSGTTYRTSSDLSYGQLTVTAALVYFPHHQWTIVVAPFVEGRAVSDSDQSYVAFGGKLSLRQQVTDRVYLSEYYLYRHGTAAVDTYSYGENALGLIAGVNWTKRLFMDLSYEYSRGDSFLSVGRGSSASLARGRGQGRNAIYSTTLDRTIVRETVDRHTIGGVMGVDWSKSVFSTIGYTYTSIKGDSGSSSGHSGSVAIGYRF
jgi:hypothetical protein